MYLMSTFEHSTYLELAISALEMKKIPKESILAIPLNNRTENRRLLDTIHHSDGISLFDLGAALGTGFSVIGASIGFRLDWGPIVWGIIAAIVGFVIGVLISLWFNTKKRKKQRKLRGKTSELILIIYCDEEKIEMVEEILWDNLALGVATLDNDYQSV
ncbi:lipopolysaccharide assembly protein LapA domain-containing protein [Halobacillus ihumii]|uniref:lipopolysaccharide assembly protein LapA domain-containing protein n=1 Tax=Halobacillus ihumii TaxID=2686092 RepID=UPI0013D33026|nr:lipopolysaccharide assembly protein LapA domain-containing protein [Halobacillus ihumii]